MPLSQFTEGKSEPGKLPTENPGHGALLDLVLSSWPGCLCLPRPNPPNVEEPGQAKRGFAPWTGSHGAPVGPPRLQGPLPEDRNTGRTGQDIP